MVATIPTSPLKYPRVELTLPTLVAQLTLFKSHDHTLREMASSTPTASKSTDGVAAPNTHTHLALDVMFK